MGMGILGGLAALAFPVAAVVTFVMIMMKWDKIGTAKGIMLVLGWAALFVTLALR